MPSSTTYSPESYAIIIRTLVSQGWHFSSFVEKNAPEKSVFLRHDIDYTLAWAVETARINARLGATGTFFLQVRCDLYNIFSYESSRMIEEIRQLGQLFGFHHVISHGCSCIEAVKEELRRDYELFLQAVPWSQPVFAWHNPAHMTQSGFMHLREEFPGLANAYGSFTGEQHPYYSDSNARYSPEEILAIIEREQQSFQLALAPMLWQTGQPDMPRALGALLARKTQDCEAAFMENDVFRAIHPRGIPPHTLASIAESIGQPEAAS
ncbi:hypothetical protein [Nitratidesulfovibrio vulgaris]|uniref:hypothetical protein n=1 Tax=Nitratidesulfovibrio vulgaris TaxID=881 RepID=UPI0023003AB0|nr:hypothetical protein [Nitratidesulfovibrio vulgaris]WCB46381.1 hypothetical protein PH214_15265 [Nitratidesulfovibrio vulgaris]